LKRNWESMLPLFENSNKKDINFKDLLHYAGLGLDSFYRATLDSDNEPSTGYYRKIHDEFFLNKGLIVFF
jgi:hypothetical protein